MKVAVPAGASAGLSGWSVWIDPLAVSYATRALALLSWLMFEQHCRVPRIDAQIEELSA